LTATGHFDNPTSTFDELLDRRSRAQKSVPPTKPGNGRASKISKTQTNIEKPVDLGPASALTHRKSVL
jgi:hypothetical protein